MAEISKTVDQALMLLVAVAERGPASATELSRSLGMNRTVVHRLLNTLHRRGFLGRQPDGYVLGAILVRMAERVMPALRTAALPVIQRLSEETGETIVLSVSDDDLAVVVDQALGTQHMVRVQHTIGSQHPLFLGASGRAILAFLEEPRITKVLRSADDPDRVRRLLAEVRALGYAVSHDELQRGVHGLAAPVLDPAGHAVACVALLVPVARSGVAADNAERVLAAAGGISDALFSGERLGIPERAAAAV